MLPKRTLVLGGSRSGKSSFAETLVRSCPAPWTYIATAQAFDAEMAARIAAHRDRRGPGWHTLEAPRDIAGAFADLMPGTPVLLDCATLWLSNQMLDERDIAAETDRLLAVLRRHDGPVVTVSNEVGMSVVPETPLGRRFRDAQGILNQRLAAEADLAVLVVAGLPVTLKGTLPGPDG